MSLKSSIGLSVSMTGNFPSETVDRERDFASIFSQIEAQLLRSETYHQAIASLRGSPENPILESDRTQDLLKSVGEEAIRLAWQQLSNPSQPAASPQEDKPTPPLPQVSQTGDSVRPRPSHWLKFWGGRNGQEQKLTPMQIRQEKCRQIGQLLRETRQQKSLSVRWVFSRTYIPMHQIEALEEGRLDQLPEDIYLRSFIRQVGNVLGLDGVQLAASLPTQNVEVLPSWGHSSGSVGFQVMPVHLYLGYAALVAGAVGGLSVLSERSLPKAEIDIDPQNVSLEQPSDRTATRSQQTAQAAAANIAPPEKL